MSNKPVMIDLCCGLGGWAEGGLAEGYHAIGYDIEAHEYGDDKYPGELRLGDVLTLDGAQFADAALIVASPPCQEYSYMAMPWKRGKQIARALRGDGDFPPGYKGSRTLAELTAIFDACFRIQREASKAAGRYIPMVVENVRGAEPWVGQAKWSFGSYYLWGDVPALMPATIKARKNPGFRFDGSGKSFQSESVNRQRAENHAGAGIKQGGSWFHDATSASRTSSSKSPARKAASAKIAKIPFALSSHIARTYKPKRAAA